MLPWLDYLNEQPAIRKKVSVRLLLVNFFIFHFYKLLAYLSYSIRQLKNNFFKLCNPD